MPAPLHIPPRRADWPPSLNCTATCLGRVSLVMMASIAWSAWPGVSPNSTAASMIPDRTLSIGKVKPMRPVEPTSARPAGKDSARSVKRAISNASFNPCLPVQALALPELATMAWARPRPTRSRQTFTGAAQVWLVVNMPAAVAGTSDTINARSRLWPFSDPLPVPSRLISQNTPDARKPRGATIEPSISVIVHTLYRPGRHCASAKSINTFQSSAVIECLPARM